MEELSVRVNLLYAETCEQQAVLRRSIPLSKGRPAESVPIIVPVSPREVYEKNKEAIDREIPGGWDANKNLNKFKDLVNSYVV